MVDAHRPLVVGQPIGRRPTPGPHGPVESADHRQQDAVPGPDHHHPMAAPGQPGAQQICAPARCPRAPPPGPAGPHPRSGDPRPVGGPLPARYASLDPATARRTVRSAPVNPSRRRFRTATSARTSPLERLGAVHPLLDLGRPPVDDPAPADRFGRGRQQHPVAQPQVASHGVMGAAGQATGRPEGRRQDFEGFCRSTVRSNRWRLPGSERGGDRAQRGPGRGPGLARPAAP